MAKLIVMREGVVEQTVQLSKERMTFGRHRHNDVVLAHPAVSGEHAIITTILDDSFLEDLHSTNGSFVNGHRIGKHFLQHKDVIKMAKYHLEFVQDGIRPLAAAAAAAASAPTAPPAPANHAAAHAASASYPGAAAGGPGLVGAALAGVPVGDPGAPGSLDATVASALSPARIELLNGPNVGKSLTLSKPATSLGRPGVQVVVITRLVDGYTAAHVEGEQFSLLNNAPLGRVAKRLSDGDVLDLGGTRMSFRAA